MDDTIFLKTDSNDFSGLSILWKVDLNSKNDQLTRICIYRSMVGNKLVPGLGSRDVVGQNLYYKSAGRSIGMILLDRNVTAHHEERTTIFNSTRSITADGGKDHQMTTMIILDEADTIPGESLFPIRHPPDAGSCSVDVLRLNSVQFRPNPTVRFQCYIDDENLLQTEIDQCRLST